MPHNQLLQSLLERGVFREFYYKPSLPPHFRTKKSENLYRYPRKIHLKIIQESMYVETRKIFTT